MVELWAGLVKRDRGRYNLTHDSWGQGEKILIRDLFSSRVVRAQHTYLVAAPSREEAAATLDTRIIVRTLRWSYVRLLVKWPLAFSTYW